MRTRHQPVAALVLVVILAAPVLAGPIGGSSGELVFTRVPDVRTPVEPSRPVATGVIVDVPVPAVRDSPRPDVEQPSPVAVKPRATPKPQIVQRATGTHRTGTASWYCGHGSACHHSYPGGLYAAAGPALRVGSWRGRTVIVRAGGRSVAVRLIDWCACPRRIIDLYSDAFIRLAPLSRGVLKVTVTW
jgi:rare lipoprotein A (peptidoglycan hydrolase)